MICLSLISEMRRMTSCLALSVFLLVIVNFLLVFLAGGRYNTLTGLPVVVGGYGSLCLALVGGGTEGFFFSSLHVLL